MFSSLDSFLKTLHINVSEIQPGNSAVLNGNYLAFYAIHCIALTNITISLISCLVVITSILCNSRKDRWDFSDRFPLYLAVADFLWGISHFTDHIVLVLHQVYPERFLALVLSINLWIFLGYQQLMHAGLAAYTYLRIVRRVPLDLGKCEWKLHLFCLIMIGVSVGVFYPMGSFGCSGYWFLQDIQTSQGLILGIYIAISTTTQGLFTTLSYISIKKVVETQKKLMSAHAFHIGHNALKKDQHSNAATQYLHTFVRIALSIYCPFAVAYWILVIESIFGFFDPITALVAVIVANSSGWANALGYFQNKRSKDKKLALKQNSSLPTLTWNSSTSTTKL